MDRRQWLFAAGLIAGASPLGVAGEPAVEIPLIVVGAPGDRILGLARREVGIVGVLRGRKPGSGGPGATPRRRASRWRRRRR